MQKGSQWIREAAFQAARKETFLWGGALLFLLGLGRALDTRIFLWLETIRDPILDGFFILLTEYIIYGVMGALILLMLWRVWRNENHKSKLVPAVFALVTTLVAVAILKAYFEVPRPYVAMDLQPLVHVPSYSFPSGHTAAAFALLIPFFRISWVWGIVWAWVALMVGFARIYELVHYPSDIAAGIFVGGIIGAFFSNRVIHQWLGKKWEEREFRRQTFHLIAGFSCVFMHWIGLLRLRYLGILLIVGAIVSYISQRRSIPVVSYFLERFDRPRDKKFPGRGAFYFCLSVFIIFALFNGPYISIAYAAILILAVGDSFNHYVAPRFHEKVIPWNNRKLLSGLLIGILAGTFSAQFFVPWKVGLIACSLALLVETCEWRVGKYYLDDNLTVPLVAAFTMYLFEEGLRLEPLLQASFFFAKDIF